MNPRTIDLLHQIEARVQDIVFRGNTLTMRADGSVDMIYRNKTFTKLIQINKVLLYLQGNMIATIKANATIPAGQKFAFRCSLDAPGIEELERKFNVVVEPKFKFRKRRNKNRG
jgi:hypothetical protein